MLLTGILMTLAAFVVSFIVTDAVRRRALRRGQLEVVTDRSSHTTPTPSSGGLGIAAGGTIVGLGMVALVETVAVPVVLAGAMMAIIGFAVILFTFLGVNFLLKGHHGEFTRM